MQLKTKDYKLNEIFSFLREGKDLSRKELAQISGISESAIEKYEYGISNYTYKAFFKVTEACNLDIIIYNNRTKIYTKNYKQKDILKAIRKTKGLTQKELAEVSRVSISNIEKYESGIINYTFEVLLKIANSCGLDIMIKDKE